MVIKHSKLAQELQNAPPGLPGLCPHGEPWPPACCRGLGCPWKLSSSGSSLETLVEASRVQTKLLEGVLNHRGCVVGSGSTGSESSSPTLLPCFEADFLCPKAGRFLMAGQGPVHHCSPSAYHGPRTWLTLKTFLSNK